MVAILLLLVLALPASADSTEAGKGPLENHRYEVKLLEDTGECCPRSFRFRVLDKAVGITKELTMTGRVAEVLELRLPHVDRLVLIGRLRYGGEILLIGDLFSGVQMDTLWVHEFGFSPSGRYLIYHSHHPRHAIPLASKSIVLIYDLAANAEKNRLPGFADATYGYMPGWPVYPEINATRVSYDVRIAEEHHVVSPFLWSPDETRVVFIVRWENRFEVVVLQLHEPGTPPGILQKAIDVQAMILPKRKAYMEPEEIENISYRAGKLEWVGSRGIIAHTHSAYFLLQDRLTIELPGPDEGASVP